MFVVEFNGGLGNQMFEYAAARAIAVRQNMRLKLHVEALRRTPPTVTPRNYELSIFRNIDAVADVITPAEVQACDNYLYKAPYKAYNRLRKLLGVTPAFTYHTDGYSLVGEPFIPHLQGEIIYMAGLWQNEKWFLPVADAIRHEFAFPPIGTAANADMAQQIGASNAVSLHVRRGDYLTEVNYADVSHVCSVEYYKRAVDCIAARVPLPTFYIFSDELDWVRDNLAIPYPCVYVDINSGANSYEDMRLMSLCQHHIIANSTFSWWGAWLNPRFDKTVIAPELWLPKANGATARHIVPPSWACL